MKLKCKKCIKDFDHKELKTLSDNGVGWFWKEWVCKCGNVLAKITNKSPTNDPLFNE